MQFQQYKSCLCILFHLVNVNDFSFKLLYYAAIKNSHVTLILFNLAKKRKCISVTIDLKKKSGKAYQLTVKHGYREHAFNK